MKFTVYFPPFAKERCTNEEETRTVQICENDKNDYTVNEKDLLFNGGPKDANNKLFAIFEQLGNFSHCLCILWAANDQEALDNAVDNNLLDSLMVDEEEVLENGEDCYCRLGNASEPFDISNLSIALIPNSIWQSDWQFVFALGRSYEGGNINTAADVE